MLKFLLLRGVLTCRDKSELLDNLLEGGADLRLLQQASWRHLRRQVQLLCCDLMQVSISVLE